MRLTAEEVGERTDKLLGLSPEAIADRRNSIGASDANIILGGDPTKLMNLWRFKVGLDEAEDLSGVLPVQMGIWTEAFNLRWYAKQTGNLVSKGAFLTHREYPWLTATLDGVTSVGGDVCPIEAKHVGPFNYTIDAVIQRYRPQLAVQMACFDAPKAVLSVISGNSKWEYAVVDRDPFYEDRLILECKRFWACVTSKTPPIDLPELLPEVPVEQWIDVDHSTHNAWCAHEQDYLEHKASATLFEHAEKELRTLVPPNAKTVTGKFLVARRSKNGALRISEKKGSSK